MGKSFLLIFVLFLLALGYVAVLNKEPITFTLTPKTVYEMPKIALILLSSAIGALITLMVFFVRDTKRFIESRQYQRKQKKEMKIQELYSKALNAILGDSRDEAKSALESILQEDHGYFDALLRLGDIAVKDGDNPKALNYYRQAADIQPRNIEVLLSLSATMEKMERTSEALTFLEEILELDSDNLTALYRKRSILERKGNWDEIIHLQRAIIKSEHDERDRQREQANLIGYKYEQGRSSLENGELEKAKKSFKTVLRLDNDFVPAYIGTAEVMLREGETEDAVNFLEKGFEQIGSPIILARIEDLLISLGEPGRLIRLYRSVTTRNPKNQTLRFLMGKVFYRLEMIDDAYDTLMALDATPYPESYQLLGNIYARHQQYEKAIEEYRNVINLRTPFGLPYCCMSCGSLATEWSGRCSNCREWNTYQFNLHGSCKA